MTRVRLIIEADLTRADGSAATDDDISNVLSDCLVQVAEPIFERADDGNDTEGTCGGITRAEWSRIPDDGEGESSDGILH